MRTTDPTPPQTDAPRDLRADDGFSTAELLGNAALGVAALVAIWALLTNVGTGVMTFITTALGI